MGIGERANGHTNHLRLALWLIIYRRAAIGAEVESDLISAVGGAHVNAAFATYVELAARKPSLRSEDAPGSALTS